jgi:hypothetical protein
VQDISHETLHQALIKELKPYLHYCWYIQSERNNTLNHHIKSSEVSRHRMFRLPRISDHLSSTGIQQLTHVWQVAICIFIATPLIDFASQLIVFFAGFSIPNAVINCLSWVLFAILVHWLFSECKGAIIYRIFLFALAVKWTVYILLLGEFELRKDIIMVPLLLIAIFEKDDFRRMLSKLLVKYRYVILLFALLTFVPFINQYMYLNPNSSDEGGMYRTLGIWGNSKEIAGYFIVLMVLMPKEQFFLIVSLFVLVIYSGARSSTLAAFVYFLYALCGQFTYNAGRRVMRRAILTAIILVLSIVILNHVGKLDYIKTSLISNFRPLLETSITSDDFGSSRMHLNRIAINEMGKFDSISLIFGKSYTSLGDVYEREWGTATWPHNDFVMTAYCHGFLGLGFYVYYLFVYPWTMKSRVNSWPRLLALQVTIFILATTAGFYGWRSSQLLIACYALICKEDQYDGSWSINAPNKYI